MLLGSFTYSIDEKGRVFVPAKLREDMGESFVLIYDGDSGCLAGYSAEKWERVRAKVEDMPREVRLSMRGVFLNAIEVTPDKQGRVVISPELREKAGLEEKTEVVIIGAMTNIEIWSKQRLAGKGELNSKIPGDIGL